MLTALAMASAGIFGALLSSSFTSSGQLSDRRPPGDRSETALMVARVDPSPLFQQVPRPLSIPLPVPFHSSAPLLRDWSGHLFHHNSTLPVFESELYEFKVAQGSNNSLAGFFRRYVCAFLNARGGQLFLGIDDSGQVVGVKCDRERYDRLCLEFDRIAEKHIYPQVDPSLYSVEVYPVLPSLLGLSTTAAAGEQGLLLAPRSEPLCVLVITFLPPTNTRNVYHETYKQPCTRAAASVRRMSPELVRDRRTFGKASSSSSPTPPAGHISLPPQLHHHHEHRHPEHRHQQQKRQISHQPSSHRSSSSSSSTTASKGPKSSRLPKRAHARALPSNPSNHALTSPRSQQQHSDRHRSGPTHHQHHQQQQAKPSSRTDVASHSQRHVGPRRERQPVASSSASRSIPLVFPASVQEYQTTQHSY